VPLQNSHRPSAKSSTHYSEPTTDCSQRELADRAGVSAQSLRNSRDVLEALGLVSIDGNGWRLQLAFRTTEERRAGIVPDVVSTTFIDVVSELLEAILPPERYGDPDNPVGETLFWPLDPWILLDRLTSLRGLNWPHG
jgi:hypothetical protein